MPDDRPTAHDVNGCCYYIRYDPWTASETVASRPATLKAASQAQSSSSKNSRNDAGTPSNAHRIWQNTAQVPLRAQDINTLSGCKMTLISVDTLREHVHEVAVMMDPMRDARPDRLDGADGLVYPESPMFVDVYTKAYETFGVDVAYLTGKAFTRRMFRADSERPHYHLASPWQGVLSLEPYTHSRRSIRGYHRRPGARNVDAILACELRSNFAASRSSQTTSGVVNVQSQALVAANDASKRMSRIRNRSSQLSESTKDAVAHLVATGGRSLRANLSRPDYGLALAREPLGGGSGDEAKLGKLIVYPEGQAFIDLVIAANCLLFNRLYERAMPWLSGK